MAQLSEDQVVDEEITPYYFENIINAKDSLLLCSDGLYTIMDDNLPDDRTAVLINILGISPVAELKERDLIN